MKLKKKRTVINLESTSFSEKASINKNVPTTIRDLTDTLDNVPSMVLTHLVSAVNTFRSIQILKPKCDGRRKLLTNSEDKGANIEVRPQLDKPNNICLSQNPLRTILF
jgi:hypothetical protein